MGRIFIFGCLPLLLTWQAGAQETPAEPSTAGATTAEPSPAAPPTTPAVEEPVEEIEEIEVVEGPAVAVKPSPFSADAWADSKAYPRGERTINLLNPVPTRAGALLLVIDHRTRQPVTENTWRDYFGLDAGGLKIGIGMRYGILDDLDAGFYRLNGTNEVFDVYQFDARFRFLRQEKHFINAAIVGGLTWFAVPDAADALGGYGQLLLGRTFARRLTVNAAALFHSDSTQSAKYSTDTNWSLAAAAQIELRLAAFVAWDAELAYSVLGYGAKRPAWSTGLKFITWRHSFSIVFTNDEYVSADGIVANTNRPWKDVIIGFNLTREFPLAE